MKVLKGVGFVVGAVCRIVLAGLIIVGTFVMNCIGIILGAIIDG